MLKHSEKLENTELWKIYEKKISTDIERSNWIKKVYKTSVVYLNDVRQNFINYTLHDGTHVLNVLDAMGGLLGDYIEKLSEGEMELLILAACLHDLGMVYTEEEKSLYFEDEEKCKTFLREHCPELLGCVSQEWPEDTRQWYLRTLHPFRLLEVLQSKEWKNIFDDCPTEIVSRRYIVAVCQAHGEDSRELRNNEKLEYLPASDTDPLFCALLLRLADLMDFDDTRAPKALYRYAECNDKSREEWDKHQASAGFRYPPTPSTDDLPYKARCKNPMIEHAVRDFLNWIDDELGNCIRLQRHCKAGWQQNFPFPRAVDRREIESDGYMSGDFCLTMDQRQIMNLLMGENLYDDRDVFVRELLQNAIDATLLRGEMDDGFIPEKSRIDLWEWNDKEGNFWFRIDDQGTGMTLGMLQRYFLKVGNSYYTSPELQRDLREHGQTESYQAISRFGIGFLSCFLCGDNVEVSTLYFDPEKNRREAFTNASLKVVNYGLRLQVTGLTGYFTLKNQAEEHPVDGQLPMYDCDDARRQYVSERYGYRSKPGTSIVVRLDPGKLGALNLRETVEKYLCGARVPVYYNNTRIGKTYEEVMQSVHELAGETLYELTPELKKKFDDCFPAVRGQYPKLAVTVIPLDTEENHILQDLSGALFKYEVRFSQIPKWKAGGLDYEIVPHFDRIGQVSQISIRSCNSQGMLIKRSNSDIYTLDIITWDYLINKYGFTIIKELEAKFETFEVCPQTGEQLGEVWFPFSKDLDLNTVWIAYQNYHHEKDMLILPTECGIPSANTIFGTNKDKTVMYVYQGIIAGVQEKESNYGAYGADYSAWFLLDKKWKPIVEISRTKVVSLPLKVLVAICGIFNKYHMLGDIGRLICGLMNQENTSLYDWRRAHFSSLNLWMSSDQNMSYEKIKQSFAQRVERGIIDRRTTISSSKYRGELILDKYLLAYFQDSYSMSINYEKGQTVTFCEKEKDDCEGTYDIFPPMMFCKAASEQSRKYICHTDHYYRRGITADHPFVVWLLNNSFQLNQYFKRQFRQIIDCLCENDAAEIISEINAVRQQLLSLTDRHGVNVDVMPQLTMDDFWSENNQGNDKDDGCPF